MTSNVIPMPSRDAGGGFATLAVTQDLHDLAHDCRLYHQMAVVSAPPGCGKTKSWEMIAHRASDAAEHDEAEIDLVALRDAERRGRVRLITCIEGMKRLGHFLNHVLRALDADRGLASFEPLSDRVERIKDWLRQRQPLTRDEPGPLLIFDEAQYLDAECMTVCRQIWDTRLGARENSCGIIFSGNPTFTKTLRRKEKEAAFGEFTSRIARRKEFGRPTSGDVLALCAHLGVADRASCDFLCEIGITKSGALRLVANVVTTARSDGGGGRLTLAQLRDAAAALGI